MRSVAQAETFISGHLGMPSILVKSMICQKTTKIKGKFVIVKYVLIYKNAKLVMVSYFVLPFKKNVQINPVCY